MSVTNASKYRQTAPAPSAPLHACFAKSQRLRSSRSVAAKKVSFGTVDIREHNVRLGNNPSCSSGPPIALEWEARRSIVLSVDEFEVRANRRTREELVMPRHVREDILRRRGYSRKELFYVTCENVRLRREHLKSVDKYLQRRRVIEKVQDVLSVFRRSSSSSQM
eukprot:CAMPEP_0196816240 /NCGR_PEP_ID=MMETSP1362-20130617/54274_1 /TAXON_ID=163516 /ORGANISM="Leptocylindrus danicus, Strain CCMP1856" /LENGTH=164 /DNA_ID=CAMNT_0042193491 /DNA_START=8 /DNA_END=502 /DNA_ORIENTATION=+